MVFMALARGFNLAFGIQQYLNVIGLGFLNITLNLAIRFIDVLLIIIRILRGMQVDIPRTVPRIDNTDRVLVVNPFQEKRSFESIFLETKSKIAGVRSGSMSNRN